MSINIPNVSETCGKCGRVFHNHIGLVSPIDEEGKLIEEVLLCRDCMEEWGRVYKSYGDKPVDGFYKWWSTFWNKFMNGKVVSKEKVEFI